MSTDIALTIGASMPRAIDVAIIPIRVEYHTARDMVAENMAVRWALAPSIEGCADKILCPIPMINTKNLDRCNALSSSCLINALNLVFNEIGFSLFEFIEFSIKEVPGYPLI